MSAFVCAGAGFLLAVIWFDLMFDVQVRRHRDRELPEEVLASISGYYGRVTTSARPMNKLVTAVMLGTLVAIALQIVEGDVPRWVGWTSAGLAGSAILLAAVHTFPGSRRLGARAGTLGDQSGLARSVCRDHLLCMTAIAALLAVQLAFAR